MRLIPSSILLLSLAWFGSPDAPTTQPADEAELVTLELRATGKSASKVRGLGFTARITADALIELLESAPMPLHLRTERQQEATADALRRVSMEAVVDEMGEYLLERFGSQFDPHRDVITVPVPEVHYVTIQPDDVLTEPYRGPKAEIAGFLLHDITEVEYINVGVRIMQVARQLIDAGNPAYDHTAKDYYRLLAEREVQALRAAKQNAQTTEEERREVRKKIAGALGVPPDATRKQAAKGDWHKESRRFTYIIRDGEFIYRLRPLVERMNREMALSGFEPPSSLEAPGINFDPEIGDVEIVLPRPMLTDFLAVADQLERRMAESSVISIEAVRLTDRDIVSGALASRMQGTFQGVHDPDRGISRRTILREVGLNSLLAIANQQLQVQTLSGIAAGALPAGTPPISIAPPTLPPLPTEEITTLGVDFSTGADDIFFDGRQQVSGFSYIGPDGIRHRLTTEVVDSLREFWDRIERNLIVHKIKKTDMLTEFSVPVGPNSNTYRGIAALISQENQEQIVATGTGAIQKIEATAGTWLIIEDFNITPIPGSSTTMTEQEREAVETKVLLTMLLRDPRVDLEYKHQVLAAQNHEELQTRVQSLFEALRTRRIRPGRESPTYGHVFDERYRVALNDERIEKKERNSVITLTFYSSQGNIIQQAGTTALGDANDLTSFTTELRPNSVTPISSFFTATGSGATGTSPLAGVDRGERIDKEKTMAHLIIRARFPTIERERADRFEGRHQGYFELPFDRTPNSTVDVPFLSSSEHPCIRLAKLRVGLMFPILSPENIRKPLSLVNPNRFPGDTPPDVFEAAASRYLMVRKIISDSPNASDRLSSDYKDRFIVEVRSLLEFDEDFFDEPNFALRNMKQWNDADRIILALNNSPDRFAFKRLLALLDDLGNELVTDEYIRDNTAYSPEAGWDHRKIYPLSDDQVRSLRRDVAAHYLRFIEAYGDAFLEAISNILGVGTYRTKDINVISTSLFQSYLDFVVFDASASRIANSEMYPDAHANFLLLKRGGYKAPRWFEPSLLSLEHLPEDQRALVFRGPDIISATGEYTEYGY